MKCLTLKSVKAKKKKMRLHENYNVVCSANINTEISLESNGKQICFQRENDYQFWNLLHEVAANEKEM